jgi:hypothetical protein
MLYLVLDAFGNILNTYPKINMPVSLVSKNTGETVFRKYYKENR